MIETLERKLCELDYFITKKVGRAFTKRGEQKKKQQQAKAQFNGYFTNLSKGVTLTAKKPQKTHYGQQQITLRNEAVEQMVGALAEYKYKCMAPTEAREVEVALGDYQESLVGMKYFSNKLMEIARGSSGNKPAPNKVVLQPHSLLSLIEFAGWLKDEHTQLGTKLMLLHRCLHLA